MIRASGLRLMTGPPQPRPVQATRAYMTADDAVYLGGLADAAALDDEQEAMQALNT